jgi:hypothetical protein
MGKTSRVASRAARRREDAGIKFMTTGAALVIFPLILRATLFGKGLSTIIPLGDLAVRDRICASMVELSQFEVRWLWSARHAARFQRDVSGCFRGEP